MGTELQEQDDAIDDYISFAKHNRSSMDGRSDSGSYALYSDIEIRLAWNGLSEDDEEEKVRGHQILEAASHNDSICIIQLLTEDPQLIWHRDPNKGNTALHEIARGGNKNTLEKLMDFITSHKHSTYKFRSPLLEIDWKGNTPLHIALKHCHKEVASYLINEMPPESAFAKNNHKGIMPVNLAIKAGFNDLVEDMLQRAPWSSLRRSKRDDLLTSSIVHDAILARDLGLLQVILESMPTLMDSKFNGRKPLQFAAYKGCINEFCYMLNNFPASAGKNDEFPMLDAIAGNHLDIVKEILSRFPEAIDQIYDTSLYPESIHLIYQGNHGCRPLSFAARRGYLDLVCYFLTNFPSYASECDEDGSFPIHKAVAGGHVEIVKEFIARCPEAMRQVNGEGRSVLHLVVEYARADVLSYLRTVPEIKQIYSTRDAKGYTFIGLAKKQMKNWKKHEEKKMVYAL